jgi:putative autotransporter adhesin-like protein
MPLFLLLGTIMLASCGTATSSRTFELQSCREVRLQGSYKLVLIQGSAPTLWARGTVPQLDGLSVDETDAGLLVNLVSPNDEASRSASSPLIIQLVCPGLTSLVLIGDVSAQDERARPNRRFAKISTYGTSRFASEYVASDALDLRAGGDSSLQVEMLVADRVLVLLSGQSQAKLVGEAQNVEAEISGQAQLLGMDLQAQTIAVNMRGQAVGRVHATAHLAGQIQDQSTLYYRGTPDITLEVLDQAKRLPQ